MISLLELVDMHFDRIRTMGVRAIADLHAAGVSAYVIREPDAALEEIVRLDPDGRRFVVHLVGEAFVVVRELPLSTTR